MLSIDNL